MTIFSYILCKMAFWIKFPLRSDAFRLLGYDLNMMTSSNENIFCVTGHLCGDEFPTQRPVTQSFDVFFDLRLNKRLSKQSWGWWFDTLSCPFWRHCNERRRCFSWGYLDSCMHKCLCEWFDIIDTKYQWSWKMYTLDTNGDYTDTMLTRLSYFFLLEKLSTNTINQTNTLLRTIKASRIPAWGMQ